ncbi:MAG TPA: tetratricopeptide repeat protein [Rhodanobacteraceae bacterium]
MDPASQPEAQRAAGRWPASWRTCALIPCAVLALVLVAGWLVYHPGLSGGFLFDDYANLPAIGATGPLDNAATLARYLTSGTADPTGRPLTLASFLLDARDWPAGPRAFKITNVLLHLLNGALLYAVLLRLGRMLCCSPLPMGKADVHRCSAVPSPSGRRWREAPDEGSGSARNVARPIPSPLPLSRGERDSSWQASTSAFAALFGAGAWLLHPLFVSTTLYIVQREAMLPATFVLLGILGWIAARNVLANGNAARGLVGMALAAGGCTLLAVLSKGNGALLPLLLLLIEWLVLAPRQPMPSMRLERARNVAVIVLLVLPTLALFAWLLAQIPGSVRFAHSMRDWSVPQRLLSEARALTDYLALLWLPRAYSRGLFTDGFTASTDLLHPWTTLPCVLLVLALIGAGFALRKKHPALALAILFYFAGQLIESTWLSLELYYEHRNYLPALLMFWPLGLVLFAPGNRGAARAAAAVAFLALLGALTFFRASLWGDAYSQALVWAVHNPDSARAQANAAQFEIAHGHPELAVRRLQAEIEKHPGDIQLPVNMIGAQCELGGAQATTLAALDDALEHSRAGAQLAFHWFDRALNLYAQRSCPGIDAASLQAMLDAARRNPGWKTVPGRQQDLDHMQGLLDLEEGAPKAALHAFDEGLSLDPTPDAALEQAATFGARGHPELGLQHLDFYATLPPKRNPAFGMPRIHAWVLERQHYWEHETARLRATLQADAAAKKLPASANSPARG